MKLTEIEFLQATYLTDATRWVSDTDKDISPGAALKHVLLEQVDEKEVALTAYGTNRTWLQRKAFGQGVIGTKYLFDGEDLTTRVSKQDIWKKNALRVTQNQTNSMKLECIQGVDDKGNGISAGNINVSTYAGDMSDFTPLDGSSYQTIASLTAGYDFKAAAKCCTDFSGLRNDTSNRLVWFILTPPGELRVNVTERNSDRGIGLLTYAVNAVCTESIAFGVYGRFLLKTSEVFQESPVLSIKVDNKKEPTRVRFSGDQGWIDLPVVPAYHCRALSSGVPAIFMGVNYEAQRLCTKVFEIEELINGISIQTPKKGANRNDVVLEITDQVLDISKRSDIRKTELSKVTCAVLDAKPWKPVVVDHTYLTDAIEAVAIYIKRKKTQEDKSNFAFEEEDEELTDEPLEKRKTEGDKLYVCITQAYNKKFDTWLLYIEPQTEGENSLCKSALVVNTKETTSDFNEND
jgi:hypothetical protein